MRDLVTTVLELTGLLFLVAGASLFVASYSLPLALGTCGVLLLGVSALIVATAPKPAPIGQETA
jgi:hypothetical protein